MQSWRTPEKYALYRKPCNIRAALIFYLYNTVNLWKVFFTESKRIYMTTL
jgi:hypothetical protein